MSKKLEIAEAGLVGDIRARENCMPARRFRKVQRRHFVVSVALPTILTVVGPFILPRGWICWQGLAILVLMWWLVGCLGVSVGFHRLFSHRAFSTTRHARLTLGILGSMAMQGDVVYWVAIHRRHHSLSDSIGDPHSPSVNAHPGWPRLAAFWIGHMGWVYRHDVPKPSRYAPDLLADRDARFLARHYWAWVGLGLLTPTFFGWATIGGLAGAVIGVWWGGILRVVVGQHVIWSINSVCHRFGARPYGLKDASTNNALLSLVSWGESWHNNHHFRPTSAQLGIGWRQPDVGWLCIQAMRHAGMASMVRNFHITPVREEGCQ